MARSVAWAITYLTLRTVLNSLRRLLASPLRALLALAIVGYLAYDEAGELLESSPDPETAQFLLGGLSAQEQVQGLVAIAVLIHGWFLVFRMAPAALDATRSVIQASDVDYLFATPLPSLRLFWGLALVRAAAGALSLLLPMAVYGLLVVEGAARETHLMRAPAGVALALLAYPLLCLVVYGAGLLWGVWRADLPATHRHSAWRSGTPLLGRRRFRRSSPRSACTGASSTRCAAPQSARRRPSPCARRRRCWRCPLRCPLRACNLRYIIIASRRLL